MYQQPYYPARKKSYAIVIILIIVFTFILIIGGIIIIRRRTSASNVPGTSATTNTRCSVFYTPASKSTAGDMLKAYNRLPECVTTCEEAYALMQKGKIEKTYLLNLTTLRGLTERAIHKANWATFKEKLQQVNVNLGCPTINVQEIPLE